MPGGSSMIIKFILLPTLAPLLFFAIALSPVELLGCMLRGALALAISLASGVFAVAMMVRAASSRELAGQAGIWHICRTLILAVPIAAMLALA